MDLFCVQVATREERRTFTATTKEEAAAWVNAISTAMRNRRHVAQSLPNSLEAAEQQLDVAAMPDRVAGG